MRAQIDALRPGGYSPDDHARALIKLAPALETASVAAVQSSPERARSVADALLDRGGKPAFGPLTRKLDKASPALQKEAGRAASSIAAAVVAPFVALSRHPSPDVRARSVQFLATRPEPAAQKAVVEALGDPDEHVERAALAAAGRARTPGAVGAVTGLLTGRSDWPVRVRAAEALGMLAAGSRNKKAVEALSRAARSDDYALVREAAVRALARVDPAAARPVLSAVAQKDAEPRVQRTARKLLDNLKH